MEQPAALANERFYVRQVSGVGRFYSVSVIQHPIQHELVKSIAGPLVVTAERLENHERLAKLIGQFNRPLQREIVPSPSICGHPIEYKIAGWFNGPLI